jgi:hypothetical protein
MPSDAEATALISCITDPSEGHPIPQNLGIFATAADLEWFRYVYRHGTTGD